MPYAYNTPNYPLYWTSYFISWFVYMLIIAHFNYTYYSFAKNLGSGGYGGGVAIISPQSDAFLV